MYIYNYVIEGRMSRVAIIDLVVLKKNFHTHV